MKLQHAEEMVCTGSSVHQPRGGALLNTARHNHHIAPAASSSLQCFDAVGRQEGHPTCKKLGVGLLVMMI